MCKDQYEGLLPVHLLRRRPVVESDITPPLTHVERVLEIEIEAGHGCFLPENAVR